MAVVAGRGSAALLANGEVRGISEFANSPPGLKASYLAAGFIHLAAITPAPFFDFHPQSQTLYAGGSGRLEASVRSASPLTYQWLTNGTAIPGQTNAFIEFRNLRPSDSGEFRLRARNDKYETLSQPALVRVEGPPELLSISTSQSFIEGETLRLEAQAVAFPRSALQWRFNGIPISRQTNSVLEIGSFRFSMEGTYTLALSNSYGITVSSPIEVRVKQASPEIILQPAAPASLEDVARLRLEVQAIGSGPLQFQWFLNDEVISSGTNSVLDIRSISAFQNGAYHVRVSNSLGEATSLDVSIVTIPAPPSPEIITGNRVVRAGKSVRLEALARGTGESSFQWLFAGLNLPSQTNAWLEMDPVQLTNSGPYSVVAANAFGTNESTSVYLTVLPANPPGLVRSWGNVAVTLPTLLVDALAAGRQHAIALLPNGTVYGWGANNFGQATIPAGLSNVVAVAAGEDFSLALKTDGSVIGWGKNESGQASPPAGLRDAIAISGGTTHALALRRNGTIVGWGATNLAAVPAGLTNIVAIDAGANYSLGLLPDGKVRAWTKEPFVGVTNVPNSITNIIAIAAGSGGLALDASGRFRSWGVTLPAPTAATNLVSIAAGSTHAVGLRADGIVFAWGNSIPPTRVPSDLSNVVAIAAGTSSSLAIHTVPLIVSRFSDRILRENVSATLSLTAAGTPPLSYQWLFNDSPIVDATNSDFFIPSFNSTNEGLYAVIVSNPFSTTKSASGKLTLGIPPSILFQPASQEVAMGMNAMFLVQVSGTPPFSYQWMLDGTNLFGANLEMFNLPDSIPQDSGKITVRIENAFGFVISESADLRVTSPAHTQPLLSVSKTRSRLISSVKLEKNRTYRLLRSTNLIDWSEVSFIIGTEEVYQITEMDLSEPGRFYKIVSP